MPNYKGGPGGRPAVPTALHIQRGTLRSRHVRQRAHEPRPPSGRPTCPPAVEQDAQARAHWDELAVTLDGLGVLRTSHGKALGALAQALADYDRVREQLRQMNFQQLVVEEIRDKNGTLLRRRIRENPLLRRSERLAMLAARLLGEFGLTPVTQTKVQAAPHAVPTLTPRYLGA
jgi:phage terminase small subunit